MENNLIVVKQLPIIEDQLRQVKASVDERVAQVLALACTEATYKDVKKARAELNKEFQDLEARRREVKKAILAPYEAFEKLYKECAADAFTKADAELKVKITSVENGIKGAKRDEIVAFYNEYRASLNIPEDIAPFERCGINILMAITEEIVPRQTFFKDRYFPTGDGDIFASDKVLTEYRKGDRKMAAFVSARAGDIPMERRGYAIHEYQPAFIAPSRLLTQDDLRKRGFGEAIYANSTPAQRAARLQRDDLSDMDIRITRREEWMAVQTMINNSCTMQSYIDDNQIFEITVQCFAYQIQMLKVDTLGEFVVVVVDGRRTYASCASEISLRPAPFAEARGQ